MKHIAIIVLNWKTPDLTIDTINSIKKISHHGFGYHIILVDNGSPDDSLARFSSVFGKDPGITIVDTGSNLGYVDGNNHGINLGLQNKYDYFLVINSDVIVKADFLEILFKFMESNPDYGMVGPKIYFAPGFEFYKDRYKKSDLGKVIWSYGSSIDWNNIYGSNFAIDEIDKGQFDKIKSDIDYLTGCCLLIRRQVFKSIGEFDSRYFMYMEDADFSQKVIRAGYRIACIPASVIWHLNSGSSGRGAIHDYFLTRNRLIFGFRYAPWRTRFALLRDSLRIMFASPYPWQRRGAMDYYLGRLGKGSWK